MRSTSATPKPNENDERPDWLAMETRLTKIEDVLISIHTVANLMLDLLEQALPAQPESDQPDPDR